MTGRRAVTDATRSTPGEGTSHARGEAPPSEWMAPADLQNVELHPAARVDRSARLHGSTRGTRVVIGARTWIDAFVLVRSVGGAGDIVIGEDCFINAHCVLYSGSGIWIGNHVLLAPHVCVVPANHAFGDRTLLIRQQGFAPSRGGVVIEDDVWVGANCSLLDGAHIGRGAVIAAGSVVTGRVPPFTVWGGVPARHIKDRP